MSEIEGGGGGSVESGGSGEVSSSSEVSETSTAETGGESSEATQEATTEEAGESGGFDEDTDTTESPEDSTEEYDESDSEEEPDDSQEVGFSEGDDTDNADSQIDDTDYENDEMSSGDEDGVGFDDSSDEDLDARGDDEDIGETEDYSEDEPLDDSSEDNDDIDDGEAETEDTDSNADGDEADGDMDNDGDPDGSEADTEADTEDGDDYDEEDPGELEDYSDDTQDDGNEADGDMDNDGEPDGSEADTEADTEDGDDIDDAQDDGGAQADDTDSNADGDEADGDMDNDGDPDGSEADTEADTEDGDDYDEEDPGELEDYSDDTQDDCEAQADDTDFNADGDEADGDMDNDGEPDGSEADAETDSEDGDDVQDDGEAQTEDTDSNADGDEADGDIDNDGEPDGSEADAEADTEDGDGVQDDVEAQTEDTDSTADGDEADGDMDNDGEPDGSEADTEADTEDGDDTDDYDEEDLGELEDYSDDDSENRNEEDESTDGSNSEREQEEEEQAAEEENQKAAERAEDEAENADVHNADNNVDDAAESENRNPSENGTEQQNEPAETESTQTVDTENEAPRNDTEVQNDSADNKTDSSTDTRDQNEEQPDDTNSRMENKAETPEGEDAYRTAMNNMAEYMSEHNYGPDDYAEYSQDPEWQKLNADLQQSLGMEVTTDASTPSPESGKDVSATELPDNCVMVNASDIDMTYAQGMDSDQFWNHHGNTKEDYMRIAEGIPDVQQALDRGKSLDEIKQDPDLKDTAHAYFDPENMIKVEQQADGSYSFADDGRHRIAAAQELGYEIPVQVTNLPENANASAADVKPEGTATAEDVANKSDISSETRENLGAFEQNNWDNLSQVEKEQAVENLRDSIAKDLQLENKPNIAYYNNENPGDYGGYAASNNTIYINRFNMGDAAETADTIAHESRHCWQHERADNPQTEQDYQFKENFDDYVCPEDDYRGYRDQPVEADARDYAQNITDNILTGHPNATSEISPENTNSNATESEIRQREEGKGAVFDESSEIPTDIDKKVDDFESKVREPEQYDSKYDYDNQKKLEDYYKQGDGKLTDEQKSALTDELKTNYDATSKEDRGDVRVPENEKDVSCVYYDGNTKKYDIGYNWKDGTVPESREMKVMQVGDQFDRVGPPSGKCVGEVNSDGTCATREQRSIPYHLNEANITDEPSYHRYEAEQDFTKENLDNAIDNSSFYTDAQKAEMHQKVDDYYDRSHAKYGDGDGLAYGEIAPMFEDTTGSTGGGYQYDMPLSMDELENIGMISEVPRGSY